MSRLSTIAWFAAYAAVTASAPAAERPVLTEAPAYAGEVIVYAPADNRVMVALDDVRLKDSVVDRVFILTTTRRLPAGLFFRGTALVENAGTSLVVSALDEPRAFVFEAASAPARSFPSQTAVTRVRGIVGVVEQSGSFVATPLDTFSSVVDQSTDASCALLTPEQHAQAFAQEAAERAALARKWAQDPSLPDDVRAAFFDDALSAGDGCLPGGCDQDPPPPGSGGGGCTSGGSCFKTCTKGSCSVTCVAPYCPSCSCHKVDGTPLCGCY